MSEVGDSSIHKYYSRNTSGLLLASLLCVFMMMYFFVGTTTVKAEESLSIQTIYHVYVDDKHIGFVNDEEVVETVVQEKLEEGKSEDLEVSLHIKEELEVIPEFVFHTRSQNETVTEILKEDLTVEAKAIAVVVEGEPAVYVASEEEADELLKEYIIQYVSEKDYEAFLEVLEEEMDTSDIEVDERMYTDIDFNEEVELEEATVEPSEVLSLKDALTLLKKGVLEEKVYEVQEGDVLGSIANDHDLTLKEFLSLNDGLEEDSLIQIGDEMNVTAYESVLDVITVQIRITEESIPYETEVKEDDSMWKGEQEVTQEGKEGTQLIEYEITERNGSLTKRDVLSEEITEEPVNRIVVKGTKETPSRGSGQLGWPAVGGYISSYQGNRWGRFHRGIDIARPSNYDILAADNGTVTQASSQGGYGNVVRIDHNNGVETMYAHLDSIDVSVGQTVSKGQKIGVMGQTGNSTGIHLHFEVYEDGSLRDPMDYLNR
ncbi:peptidoglycan DD-metalloendopeptidase family protein [Halalkalibacter sp. AB-rgal2]|uniref:peptidoglycan DD-metalloendopeptidase family protein n=1 Tax=Halalkalibacter sp. AB-rgal2 TaxID=3242695 RepID=UPI00359ECA29